MSSTGNAHGPARRPFRQQRRPRRHARRSATSTCSPSSTRRSGRPRHGQRRLQLDVQADAKINFKFTGPEVEGFGYRAANVRAQGVYEPSLLRFDASGAAYGPTATTRATFHFADAGRPLSYHAGGHVPQSRHATAAREAVDAEARHAGGRRVSVRGERPRLARRAARSTSRSSKARDFGDGHVARDGFAEPGAHYSASGQRRRLNPRRFAAPLDMTWLDDERFGGSLTGSFTFDGSGRTVDDLVLHTTASLADSTLAGARFPSARRRFEMANREMRATFAGPFEHLPGSLFTDEARARRFDAQRHRGLPSRLADPENRTGRVHEASGTTTLTPSTIAGMPSNGAGHRELRRSRSPTSRN